MQQENIKEIYNKIEEESEGTWRYEVFEEHLKQLGYKEINKLKKLHNMMLNSIACKSIEEFVIRRDNRKRQLLTEESDVV